MSGLARYLNINMSSPVSPVMKHYSCDPNSPCSSHSTLFRQEELAGTVSTHDRPDRKFAQWSQAGQRRKEDNEEEDLLKE